MQEARVSARGSLFAQYTAPLWRGEFRCTRRPQQFVKNIRTPVIAFPSFSYSWGKLEPHKLCWSWVPSPASYPHYFMFSGDCSFCLLSCSKRTKGFENVLPLLEPNRDITTCLVPTQRTSLLLQKCFLSQRLPAHLHPFHHDFPKLLLLTEMPRLGAKTRWAPDQGLLAVPWWPG